MPVLVGALPLLAILTWWTLDDGGYAPTQWLPGTVLIIGLVAVLALNRPRTAPPLGRPLRLALGLLAGYAAWSYVSIAWAPDPGVALQGAHRALLFAAAPTAIALLPWTPALVLRAAGVFVTLITATAIVCLFKLHGAHDTTNLFLDRRLSYPTGYHNTTAALYTMAAIAAALLASRRALPLAVRAGALGSATLLEGLALICQSRSWLFTLPVVLAVAVGLVRHRVRVVAPLLVVAAGVAAISSKLLEPYRAAHGGPIDASPAALDAVHAVVVPLIVVSLLAAAAGAAIALADRRIVLDDRAERRVRRGALIASTVLVLIGAGTVLAVEPHPVGRVKSSWHTFTHYEAARTGQESSRFSGLGTARYDIWRVGLDAFLAHPVGGLGQDNFIQYYLRHRTADEEPRWTHNLEIRALAHTGIIGFLLLFGALGAFLWGTLRARRRSPATGEAAAIALAPLVVWVVHSSFDWLYEYPALTVAALGLAAAAASLDRPDAAPVAVDRPAGRRRLVAGATIAAALALMVAPVFEDIAVLDTQAAQGQWRADPAAAFKRLDRAETLSPSSRPALVEGLIARQLGQPAHARQAFELARRRAPQDWFAYVNLALLASVAGQPSTAVADYRKALALDPLEPVVKLGLRRARTRKPLTFREVSDMIRTRSAQRLGQR